MSLWLIGMHWKRKQTLHERNCSQGLHREGKTTSPTSISGPFALYLAVRRFVDRQANACTIPAEKRIEYTLVSAGSFPCTCIGLQYKVTTGPVRLLPALTLVLWRECSSRSIWFEAVKTRDTSWKEVKRKETSAKITSPAVSGQCNVSCFSTTNFISWCETFPLVLPWLNRWTDTNFHSVFFTFQSSANNLVIQMAYITLFSHSEPFLLFVCE